MLQAFTTLGFHAAASPTRDDPFGELGIAGIAGIAGVAGNEPASTADALAELLGEVPSRTALPHAPGHEVPAASTGLLETLHHEFNRVVRDPTQLTGRADWDDRNTLGFEHAPSLDELSRQAEPYPLMRDILEPRENVDRMISGFHPLARPTLLDPDETEEVLRLFASAELRGTPAALPSLTRREHHELSPDSAVHVGVSRPEARKEVDR